MSLTISETLQRKLPKFLREHCYVTVALWHGLFVCRLSVTFLRPTQTVKLFGNIFASSCADYVKILEKNLEGVLGNRASNNIEGVQKIGVFRLLSRFISKTVQNTAIVTMEDE